VHLCTVSKPIESERSNTAGPTGYHIHRYLYIPYSARGSAQAADVLKRAQNPFIRCVKKFQKLLNCSRSRYIIRYTHCAHRYYTPDIIYVWLSEHTYEWNFNLNFFYFLSYILLNTNFDNNLKQRINHTRPTFKIKDNNIFNRYILYLIVYFWKNCIHMMWVCALIPLGRDSKSRSLQRI